jgi:siderophore synthetase component
LRYASVYGVALEVHLQNSLVWLDDPPGSRGSPPRLRFVVRDLGGLRVHGPRLAAADLRVDTAPGSFTRTDDAGDVLDKVAHCLFHAHLAWVIRSLHELAGLEFAAAWGQVRALVDRCYARWRREDPALRERLDHDHAALCAARTRVKCLFTMRLLDRSSDYVFTELPNPLADAPS